MKLQIVISSNVLALLFVWVQSLYWKIRYRVWITSGLVIGISTAAVVSWITSRASNIGLIPQLLVEGALICVLAALALLTWFFRDPKRVPPERDGVILSPADGKVIYLKKVEDESHFVSIKAGTRYSLEELFQTRWPFLGGYLIGIEMNVLDVHVNRAPIDGRVVFLKSIKGGFPGLGKPNAEVRSQRTAVIFGNEKIMIGVVQIASRFVRGIVSYVKENQQVQIGQRFGMIRFGSQVDLAIPDGVDCQITVEPGQTVRAGLTVMGRYRQVSPSFEPAEKVSAGKETEG